MRFFDPSDDLTITQRRLPHWAQAGAVCFITWRSHDSIPRAIAESWQAERNRWLVSHAIDPTIPGWKQKLHQQKPETIAEFHDLFTERWQDELDACHGACLLRQPALAALVAESLMHFDGDRYEMLDFVIMPNHVHFLVTFPDRQGLLAQCKSWKHFTADQINKRTGRRGRYWQQDAFDHLVRHEAQFLRLRGYVAENPVKASLREGEYIYREAPLK